MNEVEVKQNGEMVDLKKYSATFFGYECISGKAEVTKYNTIYNNRSKFICASFEPYELIVSFIITGYEQMLAFSRVLTNPVIKFSDSIIRYECMIADMDYEYLNANDYFVNLTFEAYACGEEICSEIFNGGYLVDSPRPTPIYFEITANSTITNQVMTLNYFDFSLNKNYENSILIKSLSVGQTLTIDSRKLLCFVDGELNMKNIDILLFPVTKGSITVSGISNAVNVTVKYYPLY